MKGKFYDPYIADEGFPKRLVGFYKPQRDKLVEYKDKPVMLENCSITKSKYSEDN